MPLPFTNAQRTLLRLLSNSLFGSALPDGLGDPVALWREATLQGVLLLALKNADMAAFPPEMRQELRDSVKAYLADSLRLARGQAELSCLLENAGVPYVVIKGLASAVWYPAPELRQAGDIDFYVEPRDVARTEALLQQKGYAPEKLSHGFHHVFKKDGCRFELHYEIPGAPEGRAGDQYRAYFRDLTAQSTLRHTPFGDMRLPSPFHHGLILLLHTAHHLTNSGIGLLHLCDWAVFINTLPEETFLRLFPDCLKALGLWRLACCLTDICGRYLDAAPKSWTGATSPALGDALLADILAGGNFGQKNIVRSREAYLITSGQKRQSKIRRFFAVMLDMIYQKWPVAKRIKPLIPIGWAFYTLRYLWRAATGQRPKLYVREALKGARTRTELYDQLRLFDSAKEDA